MYKVESKKDFDKFHTVHTITIMIQITWNIEKAKVLQSNKDRNYVTFEDCVIAIEEGRILDDLPHPTRKNQRIFVLEIYDYAYVVPYIEETDGIFLKTVFQSRKHNKKYLGNKKI